MKLRVLGAHNMESLETRMESHVVDDVLALDAGGLTRALTFEEQQKIRAILLTHRHFDHVRDLLPLGLSLRDLEETVQIYCIEDTANFLKSHLLDGKLYPDFLHWPDPDNPIFQINVVDFHSEFKVLGKYDVTAVPVPHAVPAAGFEIISGGVRLFYTGDTGKGLGSAWKHISPDVLLTEVTFGNEGEERADASGHLTPKYLRNELSKFQKQHGRLPKVIISHMNPPWEDTIRKELKVLSSELGHEILVSHADMTLEL